jgi:hypothetical protein
LNNNHMFFLPKNEYSSIKIEQKGPESCLLIITNSAYQD